MSTNTIALLEKNSSPSRSLFVGLRPPRRTADMPALILMQHDYNTITILEKNSSPSRSLFVGLKPPRRSADLPALIMMQHDYELPPREEVNRCHDDDELVTGCTITKVCHNSVHSPRQDCLVTVLKHL